MAKVALVGVGVLGLAALHGAVALHLAAVEERARLRVVELQRGALVQPAVFVQLLDERLADALMHLAGMPDVGAFIDVQADVVGVKRGLLLVVVALDVFLDGAGELAGFHQLAVALVDGRAEAVGSADEANVFGADAVAQKRAKQSAGTNTPATCPKCSGLLPYGMPAVTTARFGHVTGETLFCVVAIRLISPLEI